MRTGCDWIYSSNPFQKAQPTLNHYKTERHEHRLPNLRRHSRDAMGRFFDTMKEYHFTVGNNVAVGVAGQ